MGVANLNGDGTIPKESDEWVIAEGEKQRQEIDLSGPLHNHPLITGIHTFHPHLQVTSTTSLL